MTAIMGQCLLEIYLDELLRPHFARRDDDTWAVLTDDRGPLSTFHSKIVAAYAFGICNAAVKNVLHSVRQIRNAFAHSKKPITFSHQLVVKELADISLPTGKKTQLHNVIIP